VTKFLIDEKQDYDFLDILEHAEESDFVKSKKNKKETYYLNVPFSFDIETTSFISEEGNKIGTMYIFVLGVNGKCYLGRTWTDFVDKIKLLSSFYELNESRKIIIWVHNFSYEWQFIRKFFEWENVFLLEERKIVKATIKDLGIEFRCSYILSNKSLAKVGESLCFYKVKKLVGNLDYKLKRHSNTPLSKEEKAYVINDALVVMAFIQELIISEGNINKIPLTFTGFVRNECKNNILKKDRFYHSFIKKLTIDEDVYFALKDCFQGGFTHANAWFVNKVATNVASFDFTSSYPAVLLSEKFPMTKFSKIIINNNLDRFNYLLNLNFAMTIHITFYNITDSKFNDEDYISSSKCVNLKNEVTNNGRIVSAEQLTITITEIDYKIIKKCYEWEKVEIDYVYVSYKKYLPKEFIEEILSYYKIKTELKGVAEEEYNYRKAKENLNSLYGMCVTDPCRDNILYEDEDYVTEPCNIKETLEKYNNSFSRFLYFAWGVRCTAYARRNLWSGIFELGEDYIYSDTDSVKLVNYEKHKKYFENYNIEIEQKLNRMLDFYKLDHYLVKPKNKNGEQKLIGVWDREEDIKYFKTLGAKRYIYFNYKDELKITIAGVSKTEGSKYLKWKYKTVESILDNFKDALYFPAIYDTDKRGAGKMCLYYNDEGTSGYFVDYLGNKGYYEEKSSIYMEETDYTLSLTSAFVDYFTGIKHTYWED